MQASETLFSERKKSRRLLHYVQWHPVITLARTNQGHVWYHFGLPIIRVCCLFTMMKKNSHLNVACETTSSLNLKLVCCKFPLYKCMYGLKCY